MKSRLNFLAIIIACVVLAPHFVFAGFGVSPVRVAADRLVPGATIEQVFYLVQGVPDEAVNVRVEVESRDVKDWIRVVEGDEFMIPAGVQQYPMTVAIAVPSDAELGQYRAFIRVNKVPANAEEGGQVAIAEGVRIDLELTVGDDVFEEYSIRTMDILDVAEGADLEASMVIVNEGNVPAAPAAATFELFDKYGNIRLGFSNADEASFEEVPAFSEEEIVVTFPLDLAIGEGEYWGHVRVMDELGNQVGELRTVFNVVPRGSRGLVGTLILLAWALGGIIVLLIIGWIIRRITHRKQNVIPEVTEPEQEIPEQAVMKAPKKVARKATMKTVRKRE